MGSFSFHELQTEEIKHVLSEPKLPDTHPLVTGQDNLPTYWFDWFVTGLNSLDLVCLGFFFWGGGFQKNWPQCQQLNLPPWREDNLKAQCVKIKM